ncbi:hypothetical protein HYW46_05255 [Candidatus Daviesbacteria bacterium]|nr:hypothetical protein [Candidatus Daviesbacteria bacterium]
MSLALELEGTEPKGLEIKTHSFDKTIRLGKYDIALEDFLIAAEYVLTNTDLTEGDPRRLFVERIKDMQEVDGYNSDGKRFAGVLYF